MSAHPDCESALAALQSLLLEGREPETHSLEHWRHCPHCRALGEQALRDLPPLDTPPSPTLQPPLQRAVRHQAWKALAVRALLAMGLTAGLLGIWASLSWETFKMINSLEALLLSALFALPLLLVFGLARLPLHYKLYKRLRKGRVLSGVCLGLAERTRTPAWIWRVSVLLLCFLHPGVFWIYALMAVAMPVHPEDRAGLFRFKVARLYHRLAG